MALNECVSLFLVHHPGRITAVALGCTDLEERSVGRSLPNAPVAFSPNKPLLPSAYINVDEDVFEVFTSGSKGSFPAFESAKHLKVEDSLNFKRSRSVKEYLFASPGFEVAKSLGKSISHAFQSRPRINAVIDSSVQEPVVCARKSLPGCDTWFPRSCWTAAISIITVLPMATMFVSMT